MTGSRWTAPTGEQWSIEHGPHRATVVEVGGGIREYALDGRPVLAGYPRDSLPGEGAGQVLAPWPNRLGDGCYQLDGEPQLLPVTEVELRNALHGLVRWLPWRCTDHSADSVTVSCTLVPQLGYPRALELTTRWSVGPDGLRADHTATNLGDRPAPFGLGVHPYLHVGDVRSAVLRVPAAVRLVVDDRQLPTGQAAVRGTEYDFTTARPIGDTALDTTFGELDRDDDGACRVSVTAADGTGALLHLGGSLRWVHVFTGGAPAGRRGSAVAVEPMSCAPDAFRTGTDVVTLAGGDRWQGSWGIAPLPSSTRAE